MSAASAARATIASLRERDEVAVGALLRERFGLDARERQQLLDEVRCARDAGVEIVERGCARRTPIVAAREIELQLQRGERRAQLVRGIGGEAPLRGQRFVEPRQQALRLPASGCSSSGTRALGERRHRVGTALGDGARHRVERLQAATDARYQISTPRIGISATNGSSVRSAVCVAIASRSSCACATCSACVPWTSV